MSGVVDLYLVYSFVRRLATPFKEWDAYDLGIIDERGNVLKKRKDLLTKAERNAFGVYDVMILNIKKLLEKVPGGQSKLASYAAALYLIREWKCFTPESMLNESVSDFRIQQSINQFFVDKSNYNLLEDYVNQKMTDYETFYEDAPTVNAGSGNVAGIGVGQDGEPGFPLSSVKKHRRKNKRLRDIISFKEDMERITTRQHGQDKEYKKHTRPTKPGTQMGSFSAARPTRKVT